MASKASAQHPSMPALGPRIGSQIIRWQRRGHRCFTDHKLAYFPAGSEIATTFGPRSPI